jgi:NTE family protein
MRPFFNSVSARAATFFGVPGFFAPQIPPPWFAADGTPQALSFYSSAALKATLIELVDFDLINEKRVRLSLGAVNVETGNSCYFDNRHCTIGPEHILASCALPPGFAPVLIDGQYHWDGGIVSNTPLWHVLDDSPELNALIFQVDLFSARGQLPRNLDEVLEREKDIRYSSKTRFNTRRVKEIDDLVLALKRVVKRLPAELQNDPDVKRLVLASGTRKVTIAHLINRRSAHAASSKDYEFSRQTMLELWRAGQTDVRRSIEHPEWSNAMQLEPGVSIYDLADAEHKSVSLPEEPEVSASARKK